LSVGAMNIIQHLSVLALAGLGLTIAQPTRADDWVAERLRGSVLLLQDGEWLPLQRGDVVSDEHYIKTLGNGRVQFTRGAESIELSGHTLVQILDRDGAQFTNIHQHYGEIAIEAEKRNVNHFAVVTPYLAALVKGTQFVVQSGSAGASVSVERGQVNVADPKTGTSVDISPGQGASVDPAGAFRVSAAGGGELPIIHDAAGVVVEARQSGKPNGVGPNSNGEGRGTGGNSANSGNNQGSHGGVGGTASGGISAAAGIDGNGDGRGNASDRAGGPRGN
jgi:hypothetical protein